MLYGPTVLLLPLLEQKYLWLGRHKAEAYKQVLRWNTTLEPNPANVQSVYTQIVGEERAASMAAAVSRALKEAEAERSLEEQAQRVSDGN